MPKYILLLVSFFLLLSINPAEAQIAGAWNPNATETLKNKTINAADNVVTSDDLICTNCIDDTEVTTNAGTALSDDLEEEVTLDSLANGVITSSDIANDTVGFVDLFYGDTLAGNPLLLVDECYFAKTATGGCFICEGSTDDTNEQLYCFPDVNGADTTHEITINDSTQTLTNKTIAAADNVVTADDLICTDCITDTEVTTGAGTALSDDLEEDAHCSEHDSADVDCSGETIVFAADSVDFTEILYTNTLAGNPALAVDECYFMTTATGGCFICEGSTANTNEQLYCFPDVDGTDTSQLIVIDTATQTLTNKTLTSADNTVGVGAGDYDAASIDGDDIATGLAGRSLTLTAASPDTLDADSELYQDTKCINIDPTNSTTDWLFWRTDIAITITGVDCIVAAATSVVMTPRECDANGGTCSDIEAAITCATTNTTEATSVDNSSIDAGDYIRVTRGTVTGSPGQVILCLTFTKND